MQGGVVFKCEEVSSSSHLSLILYFTLYTVSYWKYDSKHIFGTVYEVRTKMGARDCLSVHLQFSSLKPLKIVLTKFILKDFRQF